jgi:hypothetical protein
MTATDGNHQGGPIGVLVRCWKNLRAALTRGDDLENARSEVNRIARDLGISAAELRALAGKGAGAADQLKLRLEALHVDEAMLRNVEVVRDLERTCSLCGEKRRCERDLARSRDDPVWQTYCPNTQTLQALEEDKKRRS